MYIYEVPAYSSHLVAAACSGIDRDKPDVENYLVGMRGLGLLLLWRCIIQTQVEHLDCITTFTDKF